MELELIEISKNPNAPIASKDDNRCSEMLIDEQSEHQMMKIEGYDVSSSHRNTAFELASQNSKATSCLKQVQANWRILVERIKEQIEMNNLPTGQTLQGLDVKAPMTVPSSCYYTPVVNLEAFLTDKLSQ